jgi:hypothetical protein
MGLAPFPFLNTKIRNWSDTRLQCEGWYAMIRPIGLPRKSSPSLRDHAAALGRDALGFNLSQSI